MTMLLVSDNYFELPIIVNDNAIWSYTVCTLLPLSAQLLYMKLETRTFFIVAHGSITYETNGCQPKHHLLPATIAKIHPGDS